MEKHELEAALAKLRQPFHPSHITWKPGAVKGDRALAMPYADLRVYMNRLDEVCGLNWSVEYEPWGNDRVICRLTIGNVTRSSTGETSKEAERGEIGGTVAEAQAFKRAAAMFGLGRYLYNLPNGWADYDPGNKKFTEKAKVKLTGILVQHYRRATENPKDEMADFFQGEPTPEGEAVGTDNKDATPESWYVAARRNLTNGTAALADKMLDIHRNGAGPCSDKQYQYLSGLIDSLPGVGKDGHAKVLSVICQSEISSANRPSFDLATKLLDYLPTHTKVDGNKVANPNYRADVVEHITKIANALQMALPLVA